MATFNGTNTNETITPDTVSASVTADPAGSKPSDAADLINGLGGNDHLDGGAGGDTINGGAGNDEIHNSNWQRCGPVAANAGNLIHGDGGNDEIQIRIDDTGGANPVDNVAYGDGGDDKIGFWVWNDREFNPWTGDLPTGTVSLYGGAGDDRLSVEESYLQAPGLTAKLYGGTGADELSATRYVWEPDGSHSGGNNPDYLYGGAGDDTYRVSELKDVVVEKAGGGTDTIIAGNTDYMLSANVENLELTWSVYGTLPAGYHGTGNELDNVITGAFQTDGMQRLDGLGGNDIIIGGNNADTIDGGSGNDTIYGSQHSGNWAYLDNDHDTIHGGDGNDTIYGNGATDVTLSNVDRAGEDSDVLYGDAGNDEIFGLFGDDLIYGGAGDDKLWGQSENDTIYGGDGNDRIGGGSGEDHLYGDAGNDVISGTGGRDWLTGGAGDDRFDWDHVTESTPGAANRDVIVDFFGAGAKGGDVIDLSTIDANSGVGGNQAFIFGGTGTGHVHAVASGTSDSLIQADIGGAAGPELEILVSGVTAGQWTAGDFIS